MMDDVGKKIPLYRESLLCKLKCLLVIMHKNSVKCEPQELQKEIKGINSIYIFHKKILKQLIDPECSQLTI